MEAIGFPISREAACCGIYIYLGSTRVGMKSQEDLRSDYLRKYEDNYKAGWKKRKQKMLQQRARAEESPSPVAVDATPNSFLSMVNNLPKAPEKPAIIIDVDLAHFEIGATWEEPYEEPVAKAPVSTEPIREWVSNGVELFSITVEKPQTQGTTSTETTVEWGDEDEVIWEEDASEPEGVGGPVEVAETGEDDLWEDSDEADWVLEEDDEDFEEEPVAVTQVVEPPKQVEKKPAEFKPKTFEEVKQAPKPVQQPVQPSIRLDENGVRDFVKAHKLCSESDIFNAFPGQDRNKIRLVIKSALRKYKIFEKHGKFTV